MNDAKIVKQIVRETVKSSILTYANGCLKKKRKFQILDLLIPKERKIRSIVGGLETSLGTTLWEPLAKALAAKNGFTVKDSNLQCPANLPSHLNNTLQNIIDERKRMSGLYDAKASKDEIKRVCQVFLERPIEVFVDAPRGRGVDIWLIKDGVNYFFDTKTVQPNVGNYMSFMEQVINWYAYFFSRYPKGEAEARIVFPYNPYNENFWAKTVGKGIPLEPDVEAWVGSQFWDFCSGVDNSYLLIEESFNELRESGELEDSLHRILQ